MDGLIASLKAAPQRSNMVLEVQLAIASLDLPGIPDLSCHDPLLLPIAHLDVDQLTHDQNLRYTKCSE